MNECPNSVSVRDAGGAAVPQPCFPALPYLLGTRYDQTGNNCYRRPALVWRVVIEAPCSGRESWIIAYQGLSLNDLAVCPIGSAIQPYIHCLPLRNAAALTVCGHYAVDPIRP
jgi:hypothetical protein